VCSSDLVNICGKRVIIYQVVYANLFKFKLECYDICSSLTADMVKTVVSALVNSRFDYANAVLNGTS